jgi:hypothetical protein
MPGWCSWYCDLLFAVQSRVWTTVEGREFVFSISVQTCPGAHPLLWSVCARALSQGWGGCSMALITLPHLAPWWDVSRAVRRLCQSWHVVGWHLLLAVTVFLKKMRSWPDLSHWIWSWSLQWKQLLYWKKDYVCFIKHKLKWDRKKFTNYYLCCDICFMTSSLWYEIWLQSIPNVGFNHAPFCCCTLPVVM